MEEDKERYTRVPKDFLKGVKLVPRNFDMPEKPIHGEIVHRQLREDLFDTAYKKVSDIEYPSLEEEDDYFRLKKIEKYDCQKKGIIERLFDKATLVNPVRYFSLILQE